MKTFAERNGERKFMQLSRWNSLEYTTITKKNRYAEYADSSSTEGAKLWLTYFKKSDEIFPIKRFKETETPITLSNLAVLTMEDTIGNLWLEVDKKNEKVRLYREVK